MSSQLPEGATDEPGPQDVYLKVMGKDNNGPADLYGLGVRASDVWCVVPSRSAHRRDKLMYKSINATDVCIHTNYNMTFINATYCRSEPKFFSKVFLTLARW